MIRINYPIVRGIGDTGTHFWPNDGRPLPGPGVWVVHYFDGIEITASDLELDNTFFHFSADVWLKAVEDMDLQTASAEDIRAAQIISEKYGFYPTEDRINALREDDRFNDLDVATYAATTSRQETQKAEKILSDLESIPNPTPETQEAIKEAKRNLTHLQSSSESYAKVLMAEVEKVGGTQADKTRALNSSIKKLGWAFKAVSIFETSVNRPDELIDDMTSLAISEAIVLGAVTLAGGAAAFAAMGTGGLVLLLALSISATMAADEIVRQKNILLSRKPQNEAEKITQDIMVDVLEGVEDGVCNNVFDMEKPDFSPEKRADYKRMIQEFLKDNYGFRETISDSRYLIFTETCPPPDGVAIGTDGNDIIIGFDGINVIQGGAGNDIIFGSNVENRIEGGDGSDIIYGGNNNDELIGGDGDDTIYGQGGDDKLYGGAGQNKLNGGQGLDEYHIGEGLDIISDDDQRGVLYFEGQKLGALRQLQIGGNVFVDGLGIKYVLNGRELLIYRPEGSLMAKITDFDFSNNNYGLSYTLDPFADVDLEKMPGTNPGSGTDVYHTVTSTSSLEGQYIGIKTGDKHDLFTGGKGNEIVDLREGNDFANGGLGDDIIDGGEGNDVILGSAFNADEKDSHKDNDRLTGGLGRDMIFGGIGNDTIISGVAINETGASEGFGDWVAGGSGNDMIHGSKDDDFLNGGSGEDVINGGGGNDLILGDGDFIFGYKLMNRGVFTSMHTWNGNAARWTHVHNITFANYIDPVCFNWSFSISGDAFPDFILDTPLNFSGGRLAESGAGDVIYGGAGNDWIAGQSGADFIDGGEDDDTIYGSDVDDRGNYEDNTNIYDPSDDHDILIGGAGKDKIFGGSGNDIMYSDIFYRDALGRDVIIGDNSADEMYGGSGDDIMYAGTGGDKLYGQWGKDTLVAGESSNGLFDGGSGDDTLIIGSGNGNEFEGGEGTDSYHFSVNTLKNSSGQDIITDSDGKWRLYVDGRIITGITSGLLAVAENKWQLGNFVIEKSGSDLLLYAVGYDNQGKPEQVGKTVLFIGAATHQSFTSMYLPPFGEPNRAPVLLNPFGNFTDLVAGQLFTFTVPGDTFIDPDGDALQIFADSLPSWLEYDSDTRTFRGTPPAEGEFDLRVIAFDGQYYSPYHSFKLVVSPSDPGPWEPQNRIYQYNIGDGLLSINNNGTGGTYNDVIKFGSGIDADNMLVSRGRSADGRYNDLVITFKNSPNDKIVVTNHFLTGGAWSIDALEFSNGMIWDSSTIFNALSMIYREGTAEGDTITGSSGNDLIAGLDGNDTLNGGSGNDILDGGAGNDHLVGGNGNDIYVFGKGYGHDTVDAYDSSTSYRDTIRLIGLTESEVEFGMAKDASGRQNFVVRIKETGETLTILNGMNGDSRYNVQAVEFGDGRTLTFTEILINGLHGTEDKDIFRLYQPGTLYGSEENDILTGSSGDDALYGEAGNDTLNGGNGNDLLNGGIGDDYLVGGNGNDIYVFGKGYGHDTVDAYDSSTSYRDIIRLVGLSEGEVEFGMAKDASGRQNFVVQIKETGETLTVLNGMNGDSRYAVHAIEFGDGTVRELAAILVSTGLHATDTHDNLRLYQPGTLYGGAGNDVLTGSTGNDKLYGESGDDTLVGGSGNDVLVGGTGNDYLDGGAGDDKYIFQTGDGRDIINNTGGGSDLLRFNDIDPANLWFSKSGNNLLIGLVGTQDQVTVNNWYSGGNYMIDIIEAGDFALLENQVNQMVQAMAGFGAPGAADGGWTEEQREALNPIITGYWQPRV